MRSELGLLLCLSVSFVAAMSIRGDADNEGLFQTAMNADRETGNEEYIAMRKKRNEFLPDHLKHKTLADIWKKELPCECPFNVWKPVCGVDGNTYPTACFAECIGMPVFVHADCKYVKRELWARYNADPNLVPTDYHEDCEEGDDDAPDEPRRKCQRTSDVQQPQPFPEEGPEPDLPADEQQQADAGTNAEQAEAPTQLLQSARPATEHVVDETINKLEHRLGRRLPQLETQYLAQTSNPEPAQAPAAEEDSHIEWRMFNGMKVPYDTRDVPNPCPHCPLAFKPACGVDGKTYPTACFAVCVGVEVARMGECEDEH
jgi:hypothetical protein